MPSLPVFTALPYLQPGTTGSNLVVGQESMMVAWQTNGVSATFDLEYGPANDASKKAEVGRKERLSADQSVGGRRFNYTANLTGLQLNQRYQYLNSESRRYKANSGSYLMGKTSLLIMLKAW